MTTVSRPTSSRGCELAASARALALLLAGVVVGTASVVVHGLWHGLLLAAVAAAACSWALPPGWSTRLAFAVGWIGVLALAVLPRATGSYLVAADVNGYLLMALGLSQLVVAIVTVRPPLRGEVDAS